MTAMLNRATAGPRLVVAMLVAAFLAACAGPIGTGGPQVNTRDAVPVALLVPYGAEDSRTTALARSLENAARMAVDDLDGAEIDLRVYDTGGAPQIAADAARRAVDEGAKVILGPLFAESAQAAGAAVNVNLLSFSNNPRAAGGNVFLLGNTFENTARRLVNYATAQGRNRIMVVHANNPSGQIGRAAVEDATILSGATLTGAGTYEFSQQGVVDALGPIAETARGTDTNAIVFTSDTAGALPLLTQLLPENRVGPPEIQFMGLTRWDIPRATLDLPGVQGGWFALPDPGTRASFDARYAETYGTPPHPLAGLAYDGIAAIGALVSTGRSDALTTPQLTQASGFAGVNGVFRLLPDGTNRRALAIAEIQDSEVTIIDPAPRSFGGPGF